MPIAYNGNVDGVQLWIPDHHWWDSPSIWRLPKRPEDGELDWSRLFQHQRDIIRRFTATLRSLCGLSTTLPRSPSSPSASPAQRGGSCLLVLTRTASSPAITARITAQFARIIQLRAQTLLPSSSIYRPANHGSSSVLMDTAGTRTHGHATHESHQSGWTYSSGDTPLSLSSR